MRNFTLHKFLATLLMAVCSATLSVAQNVAKIGSTEYANAIQRQYNVKYHATFKMIRNCA